MNHFQLKKLFFTFIVSMLLYSTSTGQQYMMPSSGSQTITTCSGTLTDNGGPSGNYPKNSNATLVIKPGTPGNFVNLTFTMVDMVNLNFDMAIVYDGASTSAREITRGVQGKWSSGYQRTYYATNPEGILTVKFVSTSSTISGKGFSATINCTPKAQLADLKLDNNTYVDHTDINIGGTAIFRCAPQNIGGLDAPAHSASLFLSTDNVYSANDVLLGNISMPAVLQDDFGSVSTAVNAIKIPAGTIPGKYFVIFYDNYNKSFEEVTMTNNIVSQPVTITNYIFNSSKVTCNDTISDNGSNSNYYDNTNDILTLTPGVDGKKIKLTFTEFNVQATYDNVYIYDGNSSSSPLIGTFSGNTVPSSIYSTNTTGALTVRFYTNSGTTANGFKAGVSCVNTSEIPPADLIITTGSISRGTLTSGEILTINFTAKNDGISPSVASKASIYLSKDGVLSADDILMTSVNTTALSQTASKAFTATYTIPESIQLGNYQIIVKVDDDNLNIEKDETNNLYSIPFIIDNNYRMFGTKTITTCSGTIADDGWADGNFSTNKTHTTTIKPGTPGSYIQLDFTSFDIDNVNPIIIYDGLTTSSPVLASLSYYNQVGTFCATNSSGALTIRMATSYATGVGFQATISCVNTPKKPDITVSAYKVTPTTVEAGSSIAVDYTIGNIGNSTSDEFLIYMVLSTDQTPDANDVRINSFYISGGLKANTVSTGTANVTVPANYKSGTCYFIIVSDNNKVINESNEENNIAVQAMNITTPPVDFSILTPSSSANIVDAGSTLTFSCIVNNSGSKNGVAGNVGYYLSTDTYIDASDVLLGSTSYTAITALNSKSISSAAIKIPTSVATANYYIIFKADNANSQSETNETNNTSYVSVKVTNVTSTESDITTSEISVYPIPCKDRLHIQSLTSSEQFSIKLWNSLGENVLNTKLDHSNSIDLSSFKPGMYVIEIIGEKIQTAKKITIE